MAKPPQPLGSATGAAGNQASGTRGRSRGSIGSVGASVQPQYLHRKQPTVGVAVEDLEDFKAGGIEEFLQFSVGQFFVAGGFWLGVERLVTVTEWHRDFLFWFCVVCLICGSVVAYFGFRQLRRRQGRIGRIIATGNKNRPKAGLR